MKKCFSRSLSIPILYLAKLHHANYCASISKISLIFLSYDFSFKLSAITRFCSSRVALESWIERENDVIYLRV